MSVILQNILGFVLTYKYVALFFVTFLSSVGVPLPAGPSVMASAAFASQGYIDVLLVIAVGFLGNVLGDTCMYLISRKYGAQILHFLRLDRLIKPKSLEHVEKIEDRYRAVTLIVSRFQDQTTALVNIIAGLAHMNMKKFLLYIIIGDILQILFYVGIGYFFSASWQSIYNTVGVFSWLIVCAGIIIGMLVLRKFNKMY